MTVGKVPWRDTPLVTLLTKLCEDLGVSQRELARRARTSQSVISKLEANTAGVRLEVAQRIAGAFGVDTMRGTTVTIFDQMFAQVGKQYRLREFVLRDDLRTVLRGAALLESAG